MGIIDEAAAQGRKALDEYEAKRFLEEHGIPVAREELASSLDEATAAAERLGWPVVLKACGPDIAHKTERELVKVKLRTPEELAGAYAEIEANLGGDPYRGMLVQEMVRGEREFLAGLIRDPQFGPCVVFGLGGIFTEALRDVSYGVAPFDEHWACQMMDKIRAKALLGPFRGKPAADREALAAALVALGNIGMQYDAIQEIDINPLIISDGHGSKPVAVDALVVL